MKAAGATSRRSGRVFRPAALTQMDISYVVEQSPVGSLVLAETEGGLLACSYDDEHAVTERLRRAVSRRISRSPRRLDATRRQLAGYFAGKLGDFTVPVDLRLAGPFTRKVLSALADVPFGMTVSYRELASLIGQPSASRAVGNALARNPICVVVPCHRVVRSSGELGGYAGGIARKQTLLELEAGREVAQSRNTLDGENGARARLG